ncbi:hypothetical protein H4R21_000551 [Coemansia helicoidea]|uniref:Uncharacterized protein n=1 Tax=Coemansia helicoidea TaxID=1286919 RepID=A0ACC1LER9_9FUNG|nr:hypothetical protein H4R21_000551 [Coemansia helicoidea]
MIVEAKKDAAHYDIRPEDLGQIADYVNAIWDSQLTRTFVPLLFVHGVNLDLLVFTRDKWFRARLGQLAYTVLNPEEATIKAVSKTMSRLWFILTLPPDRIGQICNVADAPPDGLIFEPVSEGHAKTTVSVSESAECVMIRTRIRRAVRIRGRLAYLYKGTYMGNTVVLKLSWVPADRLAEGVVYAALKTQSVPNIPTVYSSGILVDNLFGYRLEYLVLEDCGVTLDAFIAGRRKARVTEDRIQEKVVGVIKQVANCLVHARKAYVLHRDISMGNIAVAADGTAKVIDWGYAKILDTVPGAAAELEGVEKRWGIKIANFFQIEAQHDHMTGTPHYMSIAVVSGMKKRSLFDDLESLFYVVLHALAMNAGTEKVEKVECDGFTFINNSNFARVRSAILYDHASYLESFGVKGVESTLRGVLDTMRRFLFFSETGYIGLSLWSVDNYARQVNSAEIALFMDKESAEILQKRQPAAADAQSFCEHAPVPSDETTMALVPAPCNQMITVGISDHIGQTSAAAVSESNNRSDMVSLGMSAAHEQLARVQLYDISKHPTGRPPRSVRSRASPLNAAGYVWPPPAKPAPKIDEQWQSAISLPSSNLKRSSEDGAGESAPKRDRRSGKGKERE